MADNWREAGQSTIHDKVDLVPLFVIEGTSLNGRKERHDASDDTDQALRQVDMWRKREPDKHWRLLALTKRFKVIEMVREYVDDLNSNKCMHGVPYMYRCEYGCDA